MLARTHRSTGGARKGLAPVAMARIALLLPGFILALGPATASAQTPEEIILQTAQAIDLTQAALDDAVEPIGGLLGRISPSSSYATGNRGLGYGAISVGATALRFEITNPDYTEVDRQGNPDTIEGPAGAVFADVEIGLFSGYGRTTRAKNVGSVDLLLRFGASTGDQPDLVEDIDLNSWAPIYGAGLRLGVMRGAGLPSVSLSAGFNHFTERTFRVLGTVDEGTVDEQDFDIALSFRQTSSFLLLEVGKQWKGLLPFGGGGVVWHRLESDFTAEVVHSPTSTSVINDIFDFNKTQGNIFGGIELGAGHFRLVLEGGSSSGRAYGTFFLKFLTFPRFTS